MRLRVLLSVVVSAVVSAGLLAGTPGAANAADDVKRISCRSNALHYTDSDLFTRSDLKVLMKVSWHTHENFQPDRISWAAHNPDRGDWLVVVAVGASSGTPNDVPYKGTADVTLAAGADAYRMSVFDSAFGNCSVTWSF